MSLYQKYNSSIEELIKTAMQDVRKIGRDWTDGTEKNRLSTYRGLKDAVQKAEKAMRRDLTEDEFIAVVKKEIKSHQDMLDALPEPVAITDEFDPQQYEKANTHAGIRMEKEHSIKLLMEFMPQQMSYDEVKGLVMSIMEAHDYYSTSDKGKLMGKLMPLVKGKADGKMVNEIVTSLLAVDKQGGV